MKASVKCFYMSVVVAATLLVFSGVLSLGAEPTEAASVTPEFFVDKFEEDALGEPPVNWELSERESFDYDPKYNQPVVVEHNGNRLVELSWRAPEGSNRPYGDGILREFPAQTGTFEVCFTFLPTGYERSLYFGVSDNEHIARIPQTAASFAYREGGLDYHDGAWNTIIKLEPGRAYVIRLVVNVAAQQYDVYVDGELARSSVPFRTEAPELRYIGFSYYKQDGEETISPFYIGDVCVDAACNCN